MQIKQYPKLIADLAEEIAEIDKQLTQERAQLANALNQIQTTIAFDPELKNEAQRKARQNELTDPTADTAYARQLYQVQELESDRDFKTIRLQLLRDTFRIHCLEARERIARLEADRMIA
jgi:glutathionyl-hydroquinone reductase